jgi:hypothetical protein
MRPGLGTFEATCCYCVMPIRLSAALACSDSSPVTGALLPVLPPYEANPDGHEVGACVGGVAYPPVGAPGGGTRSSGAK